jgi:hypothetical protein
VGENFQIIQTQYLPQNQISNGAGQGHPVKLNAIHCSCPYCSKDFDIQPALNTLVMRSHEMDAAKEEGMKWVRAETDTESDGIYLGHISKLEVCGVTNTYQRTVTNRMNKWVLEEGETLTHWMPLPKPPSNPQMQGEEIKNTSMNTDQKFLSWLHEMTILGYDKNVTLDPEHAEIIDLYFQKGMTPADALDRYVNKFLPRWNALNKKH